MSDQIPIGCGLSKIDGRRLASLTTRELVALLDLRVAAVKDCCFDVPESSFTRLAQTVEVLNALLAKGKNWSEPKFVPNHIWKESDV